MDTSGQTTSCEHEPCHDHTVAASRSAPGACARWMYQSPALFRGEREVAIVHRGQEYRLRITKADKLILTK
jgi:hemin uptake protein HemP